MDRLIQPQELQTHTEAQLRALLFDVNQAIACLQPGTPAHRNAIGSLENIRRVLVQRIARNSPKAPSP
ncbi:MAG: hypothetical protein KDK89_21415 [Alphaproteobacteria bacterium]|nr:hypothetical protein [Alphaproteobacteria bacterium]